MSFGLTLPLRNLRKRSTLVARERDAEWRGDTRPGRRGHGWSGRRTGQLVLPCFPVGRPIPQEAFTAQGRSRARQARPTNPAAGAECRPPAGTWRVVVAAWRVMRLQTYPQRRSSSAPHRLAPTSVVNRRGGWNAPSLDLQPRRASDDRRRPLPSHLRHARGAALDERHAHRHRHDPALSHAVRRPPPCAPPAGNADQSRDDSSVGHRHEQSDAALSSVARQAATAAASTSLSHVTSKLTSIEKQVQHTQQSHDSRFADLHKDLAGIVWEVSKLRAELTRVRQQQPQQAQQPPSAAPPALARPAVAPGEPPGAYGARSWRGGSNC